MSRVTNLILCEHESVGGHECLPIEPINRFLAGRHSEFCKVDKYAGGSKFMEIGVWVAAVNYLGSEEDLIRVVREQTWEFPEHVQLFIKQQEEDGFRIAIDGADQ